MRPLYFIWACIFCTSSAFATTFTVNSLAAGPAGAGNSGTLEYCILQANLTAGPHTIEFSVAGTIALTTNADYLPNLMSNEVTIDGTSAPGFVDAPVIIIDYTGTTNGNGLRVYGDNCEFYSLEMRAAAYDGFSIESSANDTYMTDCVIRDCEYNGIQVNGSSTNIFENNHIGTNFAGTVCAGNLYRGMDFNSNSGGNEITDNHIACNGYDGINFDNSHNNLVYGNTIGPLVGSCTSNSYSGVNIRTGSTSNIIGGTGAGEPNKIAGNLYWGVRVQGAGTVGNIISGNSISCNNYDGIGLQTGGNNDIVPSVILAATATTTGGTATPFAEVEVFRSHDPTIFNCPGLPLNQGADYLGTATADAGGVWTLTGTFDGYLVSTQTTSDGTSEFSGQVYTSVPATWTNACEGIIGTIVVAPLADFTSTADSICVGECIDFTDLSANNPDDWAWTFTGAVTNTSTDQDPVDICYNGAGTFQVELITTNGAGSNTITQDIVVIPLPVATISQNTNLLVATPGMDAYQWILDGNTLVGENNDSINIILNGDYEVIITNAFGCIDTSAVLTVSDLSLSNPLLELQVSVYPNPTAGTIQLDLIDLPQGVEMLVKDQLGRIVLSQSLINKNSIIEMDHLANGTYYFVIGYKEWQIVKKIQLLK